MYKDGASKSTGLSRCPICSHQGLSPFLNDQALQVSQCSNCRTLLAKHLGRPAVEGTVDVFEELNVPSYVSALEQLRRKESQAILTDLEKLGATNGRILDIGCSFGWFLREAKKVGWEPFGIEPSRIAFAEAAKLGEGIFHGLFPDQRLHAYSFDAIVIMDVLEHMQEPSKTLLEASSLLKPEGILAVKVPVRSGLVFQTAHKLWDLGGNGFRGPLHRMFLSGSAFPHLFYFSERSLRELAKNAHLNVVHLRKDELVDVRSAARRIGYTGRASSLASIFIAVGLLSVSALSRATGKYDMLTVYLRHSS